MADYQANLYKRVAPSDGIGADILMPNKGNDNTNSVSNFLPQDDIQTKWPGKDRTNKDAFGLVDVFNNYTWTLSPRDARQQVPKIELVEYKMVLSSEISGYLYTLLGYEDNVNVISRTLGQTAQDLTNAVTSTGETLKKRVLSNYPSVTQNINKQFPGAVGSFFEKASNAINKFRDSAATVLPKPGGEPNSAAAENTKQTDMSSQTPSRNSELDPYIGLYAIEPTGWVYTMPYLGPGNMVEPGNTWGESSVLKEALAGAFGSFTPGTGGTGASKAGEPAGEGGGGIKGKFNPITFIKNATTLGLGAGGGLITAERPKSFTGTGVDKVSVQFFLLNTHKFEDIRRNWEFCFLFTYQNLANRKGINLLDPPSVYRVLIPGYKQLPIGFIDNLKIENVGMVRLVDIVNDEFVTADQVGPNIKMIPEAYRVSFEINCGLMNARNIFSFAENPSKIVNVRMAQ